MFLTAAFTGLPLGELLALQWGDIDFAGEVIRVRRSYNVHRGLETPRSGKVRSVPMVPEVAHALAALADRDDFTTDEGPRVSCLRWARSRGPSGFLPLRFAAVRIRFPLLTGLQPCRWT